MCDFDFDFDAFMIHFLVTDPFLYGFVLGCFMVAPFVLFSFVIGYFRRLD